MIIILMAFIFSTLTVPVPYPTLHSTTTTYGVGWKIQTQLLKFFNSAEKNLDYFDVVRSVLIALKVKIRNSSPYL